MNIGIDIDNVISEFDSALKNEFLLEDKNKRNSGIVDKKKHIVNGMFDWSSDEIDEFMNNNMERIAKKLKVRRYCKSVIDRLMEDGHSVYIISHRVYPHYKNPLKTTKDWLKKKKINYTELILSSSPDKSEECKQYNIDVMIDDRAGQCRKMISNNIKCILMLTKYNRRNKDGLEYVSDWKELYEVLNLLAYRKNNKEDFRNDK